MNRLVLYWHTLRYLKLIQVVYRLYYKFTRPSLPRNIQYKVRVANSRWHNCPRKPSMKSESTFVFLNVERSLRFPDDWQVADASALWRFNLHYFDDLVANDACSRAAMHTALIRRWIEDNEELSTTGWQPYPLSLRLVNWIKWSLSDNTPSEQMQTSLAIQAGFLERRLEYHLLGNHLWANAKALIFAGAYFEGEDANRWLLKGLRLVSVQISEQILEDGGHFERSPMYHSIVLEDLIDLIQLNEIYNGLFPEESIVNWREHIASMSRWLDTMTMPDGSTSLFNDSANGIAASTAEILCYAKRFDLPPNIKVENFLEDSGFIRLENIAATLIADVGSVGPDYQPGHAHAQTLCFEMTLHGQRLIVNSGIDRYGESDERQRQRGTAAHSTVVIDGIDSSEVWSGFRVARRARVVNRVHSFANVSRMACSHDGYARISGKPVHSREWELDEQKLVVIDSITGGYTSAVAHFHLFPESAARINEDGSCRILHQEEELLLEAEGGEVSIVKYRYHPEFGVSISSQCIRIVLAESRLRTTIRW